MRRKEKQEERAKVRSSLAIAEVDYIYKNNTLRVYMTDGSILLYGDVPYEVFKAFKEAESKGKFFNAHIRNTFPFLN